MAECKTEKSKHLQRKNFGTAGEQIEFNFSARIVALNEWKNDIETILWASLLLEEESVYFIWKNGVSVSRLQANCRQLENNEQTGE